MIKRVYRQFKNTECDDMAAFFMKMAKEGWHFKEWKLGFVFEKGEPEDVEYAVEIFINGSNWDLKPDKDAEEFAEYCKEAGWEFVDYCKKFLIFRKIENDAEDIVTAKEHFENAVKEELKSAYLQVFGYIVILCLNFKSSLLDAFYINIFSNAILLILSMFLFYIMYSIFYAGKLTIWYLKNRKQATEGDKIYLGIGVEKQRKKYWRWIMIIVFFEIALFYSLILVKGVLSGIGMLVFLIIFLGCLYGIEYVRPSRGGHILSAMTIGILIPVIFAFMMLTYTDDDNVYKDKSLAPLLQENYKDVAIAFEDVQIDKVENFLGRSSAYWVTYHEFNKKTKTDEWDDINYIIVESKYDWIIERSWKVLTERDEYTKYSECTDEWDAEYALKYEEWLESYCVRYEDQIFILKFESTLSQDQINIIRDKLKLGWVM